jgi:hypothetical protein
MKKLKVFRVILAAAVILLVLLGGRYLLSLRESAEPAIAGKWNNIEAGRYVIDLLQNHGNGAAFGFDAEPYSSIPLHHFIYDYYRLNYSGGEHHLVVAYSKPEPFDCRRCAPRLSLVEFVPKAGGWAPGVRSIGQIAAGSWGSPPYSIGIMELGPDRFGVVIESSEDQRGAWDASLDIYTQIDGGYRKVASIVTERHGFLYEDQGMPTGSWQMGTLPQTSGGFYDILVRKRSTGTESPESVDPADNQVYRFNGEEYTTESREPLSRIGLDTKTRDQLPQHGERGLDPLQ